MGQQREMKQLKKMLAVYEVEHGVTGEAIAKAIGTSYQTLYAKLNGKTKKGFLLDEAAALSEILGITIDEFCALTRA